MTQTTDEIHDHDRGLSHDLARLLSRRQVLGAMASGVGVVALAACGSNGGSSTGAVAADTDAQIPEEPPGRSPRTGRTARTC